MRLASPSSLLVIASLALAACGEAASTTRHVVFGPPSGAPGGPVVRKAATGEVLLDDALPPGLLELEGRAAGAAWLAVWNSRTTSWPAPGVRARPVCLRRPDALAQAAAALDAELARHSRLDRVALAREASAGVRSQPLDWCLCDDCVALIRAALRADAGEGGLAAWNAAAGTDAATWEDVRPWSTAEVLTHVAGREPAAWRVAPWMLARAFQDATLADAVGVLAARARKARPGVRVGLTALPPAAAFGGVDPLQLAAACDFVEPDPRTLDALVFRDVGDPALEIVQTASGADLPSTQWLAWRGVARGARVTLAEPAFAPFDGPDERAVLEELAGLRPWDGGVRIVVSQPSRAIRWLLDVRAGERADWPRRMQDADVGLRGDVRSRDAAWRALAGRGARFLDSRALADPGVLDGVRLVVLADVLCLDDPEVAALRAFLAGGGQVVADTAPGRFDTLGNGRAVAPLEEDGVRLDPAFRQLAVVAEETLGPRPVELVPDPDGTASHGADVEVALFEDADGALRAVAVPFAVVDRSDAGTVVHELRAVRVRPRPGPGWTVAPVLPRPADDGSLRGVRFVLDLVPAR